MKSKILFCVLIITSLVSCGQEKDFNTYINTYYEFSVDTISVTGFKKIKEHVQIIDARSSVEYSTSKIKGAVFVNYEDPKLKQLNFNPSDTLVVYCTIGYRSEKIAEKLKKEGYKNVYNLYGGILQWTNSNNPVYSPIGTQTPFVHTYDETWGKWLTNSSYKAVH
jgi:rhodanese-related sulfurtransferase